MRKENMKSVNSLQKTLKSQQTRPFVSLTSCSLMVSVTACLMKKEKRERRKSHTALTLFVCVVLTRYLIYHSLYKRQSDTEWDRLRAMQKGRGAAAEKSEVVPPFPVTRETNALSKKIGQWQTPAIVFRQKVTWLPKHHSLCTVSEKGRKNKKKYGVGGLRVIKRGKIKRRGQKKRGKQRRRSKADGGREFELSYSGRDQVTRPDSIPWLSAWRNKLFPPHLPHSTSQRLSTKQVGWSLFLFAKRNNAEQHSATLMVQLYLQLAHLNFTYPLRY